MATKVSTDTTRVKRRIGSLRCTVWVEAGDQFVGAGDDMGEGRAVEFVSGVHHFRFERGGGIAHQGDVIAQFSSIAGGGFDAGVGQQTGDDHVGDAFLFQAKIQIGVGETTGAQCS